MIEAKKLKIKIKLKKLNNKINKIKILKKNLNEFRIKVIKKIKIFNLNSSQELSDSYSSTVFFSSF